MEERGRVPLPDPGPPAARAALWLETLSILVVMGLLLALLGQIVAGPRGMIWIASMGTLSLVLGSRLSASIALRMRGAVELSPGQAPALYRALAWLSRRADLPRVPRLFYVSSGTPNALSAGSSRDAAIAVSYGLLHYLDHREVVAVLAHEVAHLRNGDLFLLRLGELVSRTTGVMANVAVFLLFLNMPLIVAEWGGLPWSLIALLFLAPLVSTVLLLALSRAREFQADLDAALLCGDPEALASALDKLDRYERRAAARLSPPGRVSFQDVPELLRTHPSTRRRIRRLLDLSHQLRSGG